MALGERTGRTAPFVADALMALRPRTDREPAYLLLPMQLRIGDRVTDLDGEWEIAGGPSPLHGGKTVEARVARPSDPRSVKLMTWAAREKVPVRRPGRTRHAAMADPRHAQEGGEGLTPQRSLGS